MGEEHTEKQMVDESETRVVETNDGQDNGEQEDAPQESGDES